MIDYYCCRTWIAISMFKCLMLQMLCSVSRMIIMLQTALLFMALLVRSY
jgi:hypothetical protein